MHKLSSLRPPWSSLKNRSMPSCAHSSFSMRLGVDNLDLHFTADSPPDVKTTFFETTGGCLDVAVIPDSAWQSPRPTTRSARDERLRLQSSRSRQSPPQTDQSEWGVEKNCRQCPNAPVWPLKRAAKNPVCGQDLRGHRKSTAPNPKSLERHQGHSNSSMESNTGLA